MNIKKIIEGGLLATTSYCTYEIGKAFYELYKTQKCIWFSPYLCVPYYWLIEIALIPLSPLLIKCVANIISNNKITDDSDLLKIIKQLQECQENDK